MKKNKIFAGYICLKSINGILFPSYLQNKINKDFITNQLKGSLHMSQNENMYSKNSIVLNSLINEKNNISGIVMLSVFYLPNTRKERNKMYKNLVKNKKSIHCILEEIEFKKKEDEEILEESLIFTDDFFTKEINKINKFEKKIYTNKKWSFI